MKYCVAVLTRGYSDIQSYSTLIQRNNHISRNLTDKTMDILFFHEGNITEEQQTYIQNETPDLNMKFINILGKAFKEEKNNIPTIPEIANFNIGYRHMCSFWFVDFWSFVSEYDFLLRIDEDCFIDFNIDNVFSKLNNTTFIVARISGDSDFVTFGLNSFSMNFIQENSNTYSFKNTNPKYPSGPYTNILGVSLNKIRNSEILQKYIDEIDKSGMIYERRWGDLPLWGEVIYYIFGEDTLQVDTEIRYYHGTHDAYVN